MKTTHILCACILVQLAIITFLVNSHHKAMTRVTRPPFAVIDGVITFNKAGVTLVGTTALDELQKKLDEAVAILITEKNITLDGFLRETDEELEQ